MVGQCSTSDVELAAARDLYHIPRCKVGWDNCHNSHIARWELYPNERSLASKKKHFVSDTNWVPNREATSSRHHNAI
jgi:hypothetical protein